MENQLHALGLISYASTGMVNFAFYFREHANIAILIDPSRVLVKVICFVTLHESGE